MLANAATAPRATFVAMLMATVAAAQTTTPPSTPASAPAAAVGSTIQPPPGVISGPAQPITGPLLPISAPAPPSPWIQILTPRSPQADAAPIELWIYAPRHRPLHSLLPYLSLFPLLSFNHAGNGRGGGPALGQGPDAAAGSAWPGGGTGNAGAGSSGNASWTGTWSGSWNTPSGNAWGGTWPEGTGAGGGVGGWPSAASGGSMPGTFPGAWTGTSSASYNTQPFSGTAAGIVDPPFLVVRGLAADIEIFRAFVERVDVPVPEVQLRVYVLEVRDVQTRNSAVQLLLNLLDGHLGATAGSPVTEGNRLFLGGRDLSLAISRLTGDSRVRLVSSPTLRAADGSTASVTIGTDTPTLGSIITYSGTTQQSISYQSAGVLLNVSPHILNDTIRLMIWQELSSFARTETGLTATPTKLRRAFRTDVVARHGEVIMLGGLSESSQIDNRERGLFGLGSRASESATSDIVVLLQVLRI